MPLLLTPRNVQGRAAPLPGALRRESGTIAIGRDPASDMPIDHPLVSGKHCVIAGSGSAWQLHDSSTNGTLINGERVIGARALREGDVIGIAEVQFVVSLAGGAQPGTTGRLDDWGRGAATSGSAGGTAAGMPASSRPASVGATMPAPAEGQDGLTRAAVEGLAALSRARRSARSQLGAPVASDQADPFAAPGDVLARLRTMPPASATAAATKACEVLAAHERALLTAMQSTFRQALDHFSPAAIKQRAASDADAWKAYERAFAGVDGFVETFSQELAKAYREIVDR